jgi:orotidine-5'-phosphate decarboxylase
VTSTERLIVAIDEPDVDRARALIGRLEGSVERVKVGMTLYYRAGPGLVRDLVGRGWKVFVDLKCHDIPHQVAGAVAGLADLGAEFLTAQVAGGRGMLEASVAAVEGTETKVLGVTALTSLDERALSEVGIAATPQALVLQRAALAQDAGLHGVVSSPLEAEALRARVGARFEIVTPGVRPAGHAADDQRRVATPAAAIRWGASRLVVGRPITQSDDPAAAARRILAEIEAAL